MQQSANTKGLSFFQSQYFDAVFPLFIFIGLVEKPPTPTFQPLPTNTGDLFTFFNTFAMRFSHRRPGLWSILLSKCHKKNKKHPSHERGWQLMYLIILHLLRNKQSSKAVDIVSERMRRTSGWILYELGDLQQQRCAGAAPWSSVNLLTHTGSIMSLLPSSHPSLLCTIALSLSCHQSRFSFHSLPLSPPSDCSTPVFLFCISQQSPGRASARHSSTRPCPACLSICPASTHQEPLRCPFPALIGDTQMYRKWTFVQLAQVSCVTQLTLCV